jgi:steroid delta-isomerase-like uncharacterized protein
MKEVRMNKYLCAVPLVLLLCLTFACQDKAAMAELEKSRAQANLEAQNIELIKTLAAELDKGNVDIFLKLYAPDFKYYFPSNNPTPLTREDEIAMAKAMFAAIPDFVHEITEIFAVKDRVVLRFVAKGTHKAELEGIPATGNKIATSAICIFRIKDGLVVEEIEDANMLGFYEQLGMELKPKAPAK